MDDMRRRAGGGGVGRESPSKPYYPLSPTAFPGPTTGVIFGPPSSQDEESAKPLFPDALEDEQKSKGTSQRESDHRRTRSSAFERPRRSSERGLTPPTKVADHKYGEAEQRGRSYARETRQRNGRSARRDDDYDDEEKRRGQTDEERYGWKGRSSSRERHEKRTPQQYASTKHMSPQHEYYNEPPSFYQKEDQPRNETKYARDLDYDIKARDTFLDRRRSPRAEQRGNDHDNHSPRKRDVPRNHREDRFENYTDSDYRKVSRERERAEESSLMGGRYVQHERHRSPEALRDKETLRQAIADNHRSLKYRDWSPDSQGDERRHARSPRYHREEQHRSISRDRQAREYRYHHGGREKKAIEDHPDEQYRESTERRMYVSSRSDERRGRSLERRPSMKTHEGSKAVSRGHTLSPTPDVRARRIVSPPYGEQRRSISRQSLPGRQNQRSDESYIDNWRKSRDISRDDTASELSVDPEQRYRDRHDDVSMSETSSLASRMDYQYDGYASRQRVTSPPRRRGRSPNNEGRSGRPPRYVIEVRESEDREVTFSPSTAEVSTRMRRIPTDADVSEPYPVPNGTSKKRTSKMSDAALIKEQSEARHQLLKELKQAMEMRDLSTDHDDRVFWENQIATLNSSLRRLCSEHSLPDVPPSKQHSPIQPRKQYSPIQPSHHRVPLQQVQPAPPPPTSYEPSYSRTPPSAAAQWETPPAPTPPAPRPQESEDTVQVQAPEDLPAGHEFTVKVSGRKLRATVPPGGVRRGDIFAIRIPPSAETVKVRAPASLPEGYRFTAKMGDRTIVATVPPGGVIKGQIFSVPIQQESSSCEVF